MNKVNLIVIGGFGRFGQAILEAVNQYPGIHLKAIVVKKNRMKERRRYNAKLTTDLSKVAVPGDVIIDVSSADSVAKYAKKAAKAKAGYILAVTGIEQAVRHEVEKASHSVPVVIASNLSVGVAVLKELTILAASLMPDAEVEIVETHHRNKVDAPSGTALMLATEIVGTVEKESNLVFERPRRGVRDPNSIGIHAIRGGDVVGEHSLHFLMDGERVELKHAATNRTIFAKGAIRAAMFIADHAPGLYTMRDVLGLERM